MSINFGDQKSQLYKITYKNDGRYYIGITYGKNHSYLKRFDKHLNKKGSVFIKHLLNDGASKDDFSIELLKEGRLEDIYSDEIEYSVLGPNGLNGNKGHAIIQSEEGKNMANKKRKEYGETDEARQKMSEIIKEYFNNNDEARQKMSDTIKEFGDNASDEGKKLQSEKIKEFGTDEERQKMSEKIKEFWDNASDDFRKLHSEKIKKGFSSISECDRIESNLKRSKSMAESRKNESEEKKKHRIKKYLENVDQEKRGKKISEAKKGKPTNQQKIMQKRYKEMSDIDFNNYIKDGTQSCKTRAINLRNKDGL